MTTTRTTPTRTLAVTLTLLAALLIGTTHGQTNPARDNATWLARHLANESDAIYPCLIDDPTLSFACYYEDISVGLGLTRTWIDTLMDALGAARVIPWQTTTSTTDAGMPGAGRIYRLEHDLYMIMIIERPDPITGRLGIATLVSWLDPNDLNP